ncbi:hypothetical protein AB0F92_39500 [Kitasatospora aureofaciens]|uniref:hypothetical protein n=1 Tax=Kitasatospora aureofaciens TaxID=1894 RepID=UPI0033C0EC64
MDPADVEQVLAPVPRRRLVRTRHRDDRSQGLGEGGGDGGAGRGEVPGLRAAGLGQRHELGQAIGLEPGQPLLGLLDPGRAAVQLVELLGGRQREAVERDQDVVVGLQIPVHECGAQHAIAVNETITAFVLGGTLYPVRGRRV